MISDENNKARIFNTAVKLFAEKGYSCVSMREIAAQVGIKAASIYNHYESKEAILEAVFDFYNQEMLSKVSPMLESLETDEFDPETFMKQSLYISEASMKKPVFRNIFKIIVREQFTNEKTRAMMLSKLVEKPRMAFAVFFRKLMEKGAVKPMDPEFAAKEYHDYFVSRFYESSLMPDGEFGIDEQEAEAHLNHFWDSVKLKIKEDKG